MKKKEKIEILLVEHDKSLRMLIRDYLGMMNYRVTEYKDGAKALAKFKELKPSIVLVDVLMPDNEGVNLIKSIREIDSKTPILFLADDTINTANIDGFIIGVDDYLIKPFTSEEMSLRISILIKRAYHSTVKKSKGKIQMGQIAFFPEERLMRTDSFRHTLTRKESELLFYLASNIGELLPRRQILNEVWRDDNYFAGRSMDVFITRLRKYLKADLNVHIVNVHGTGFRLEVD